MKLVRDFIIKDISSVTENSPVRRVIKNMRLHRVSIMPVVNKLGEYIGCISEEDILEAAVPDYMKKIYNTSFMANIDQIIAHLTQILDDKAIALTDVNYPYVTPDDSLEYAADILYRTKGNMLPVLESKKLVGLITLIQILSVSIE
ncbi:MAG: CBS domain-containing protein [Bacteroidales bacterium]|nr:CBS domain-containing protein [Bacteroidales bacterium]